MSWRGDAARAKYKKQLEEAWKKNPSVNIHSKEHQAAKLKAMAIRQIIEEDPNLKMKDILTREDIARLACMVNKDEFARPEQMSYPLNSRFEGYDELKQVAQSDELTATIKMTLMEAIDAFSMPKVRDDDELQARIIDYFTTCANRGSVPTMEEVALYCGYSVDTMLDWISGARKGFSARTQEILIRTKTMLHDYDAKMSMSGKSSAVMYIFRSKNYYGMQDKVEQVISTKKTETETISEEDIAARYKDMGDVEVPDSEPKEPATLPSDSEEESERLWRATFANDIEKALDFDKESCEKSLATLASDSQSTLASDFDADVAIQRGMLMLSKTHRLQMTTKDKIEADMAMYREHPEMQPEGYDEDTYRRVYQEYKKALKIKKAQLKQQKNESQ